MSDILLTLLSFHALQESILDALLQTEGLAILCSTPAALHGLPADTLTQSEQVLGHAKGTEIRLLMNHSHLPALLDKLQKEFAGAGLRYWTTAVLDSGELK